MTRIDDLEPGVVLATSIAVHDYTVVDPSTDPVQIDGPRGEMFVPRADLDRDLARGRVWVREENTDEEGDG